MDEVTTTVNIFGIFFPRLTLWIAWMKGYIPANDMPFAGEVLLTVLVPNVLLAIYNFSCGQTVWGIAHLLCFIIRLGGESSKARS